MKTFDLAQQAAREPQRFMPETRLSGAALLLVAAVITAVLAGAALFPAEAGAQAYPSKVVRIVVPFPPGGGTDALGRLVAERLMERWKQQVLVENRPGATGTIGTDVVAKSPADGYTLLIIPADITITPAVYNLPFDVRKDLTPVMALTFNNMVLSVFPTLGINSMRELLNRVKADSGKWLYGSCGNGTPHHLAAELLKVRTGIELTHVPYKGCAQATTAALGGEVPLSLIGASNVAQHIKAGRLKGLAVTAARREREIPDVPTLQEAGFPDFEAINWIGLFAPGNTPRDIVTKIYEDTKLMLSEPASIKRMQDRSLEPYLNSPEQFRKLVLDDLDRYGPVIKRLGLKLD
jgi:tripartite-type tricarboxylate transporter receptor subunit TctC